MNFSKNHFRDYNKLYIYIHKNACKLFIYVYGLKIKMFTESWQIAWYVWARIIIVPQCKINYPVWWCQPYQPYVIRIPLHTLKIRQIKTRSGFNTISRSILSNCLKYPDFRKHTLHVIGGWQLYQANHLKWGVGRGGGAFYFLIFDQAF